LSYDNIVVCSGGDVNNSFSFFLVLLPSSPARPSPQTVIARAGLDFPSMEKRDCVTQRRRRRGNNYRFMRRTVFFGVVDKEKHQIITIL